MSDPVKHLEWLPDSEINAVVRGLSDEKLADAYRTARLHPATDWARRLSAEIGRRDALGIRVEGGQQ